jgi:uncharacterized phage protein (TIGR02218 family)
MPFDSFENSAQSGQPVELYTFRLGATRLDYTSSDVPITVATRLYETAPIQRQAIEETAEISRADLRITVAHDFAPAEWFSPYPPSEVVSVELRRLHRSDSALDAELFWIGRLIGVHWSDITAELQCESVLSSMRRPGLRRLYQRACPHALYGTGCFVPAASYRHDAVLSGVTGSTVQAAAFGTLGTGYLAGGYLEWVDGTRTERRAIRSHTSTTVVMSHPIPGLAATATVRVYAGCDHTLTTCGAKFSNSANFGGFVNIPQKNPFGQNSVFY